MLAISLFPRKYCLPDIIFLIQRNTTGNKLSVSTNFRFTLVEAD
jgi:hypothetical protein